MILPCEMLPSKHGLNAERTVRGRVSSFAAMTTLCDTCAFRKGDGLSRNKCLTFVSPIEKASLPSKNITNFGLNSVWALQGLFHCI